MEAINTHITQNNKIKHTFAIYRLLRPPFCKHAHSRGTAANFSSELFKRFICFIKHFTQNASRDILLLLMTLPINVCG